ncbi:MAG: DUF2492 family protein [Verrucomicrobiaceae bacterium]|nr:MAG: DUF2492 family protein [Verrucomicrobiaceae bacterium]
MGRYTVGEHPIDLNTGFTIGSNILLPPKPMTTITTINGNEIVDLVSANPNGIRLSRLIEKVSGQFGPSVTFHKSSHIGVDIDALLVFLEARNKIRIVRGGSYAGIFLNRHNSEHLSIRRTDCRAMSLSAMMPRNQA